MVMRPKIPAVGDAIEYTRCKTAWQGHDWDDAPPVQSAHPLPAGWGRVSFRCTRCGTRKHYDVNLRTGHASRPRYSHRPKAYKTPGVTRDEWRLLFVAQYAQTNDRKVPAKASAR